ncbi:membrane protein [Mycobacterium terramassiliense]|uniref:Membrane protein n=1 Tax=Mycobacterium terramassiliense TaxID=1841859 RepID=A0A2U3N8Y1_9MYCO|nr:membrane protein [Mycobacterium terramassiliense]
MTRALDPLRRTIALVREQRAAVVCQSERCLLVGLVLVGSTISVVTGCVLVHYYSVDVISSLLYSPYDCVRDWGVRIGRHCFSDYTIPVSFGMSSNPWAPYPMYLPPDYKPALNNYPAAAMLPHMFFGSLGAWLGAPQIGLFGYLIALTAAVFTPALWAARTARGLEPVVVFVACGVAAIPAWMTIDRGNSVGFVVPIALVFLVALCRQRWGLVALMVVLAALVKPQFVVLAVALFAARQWRWGGIAVVAAAVSNVAAYALWPQDFPHTIVQSMHNVLGYGSFKSSVSDGNVSFGKGILAIPDFVKGYTAGGAVPEGFLAGPRSVLGFVVLFVVVAAVVALGRRVPPVMVGIALLATASLFPAVSCRYYLVFALPAAALLARDPDGLPGSGIFDRVALVGGRRRAVGICVSVAAGISIVQIALPSPPVRVPISGGGAVESFLNLVITTVFFTPLLWLLACGAIIASYARRPAPSYSDDDEQVTDLSPDTSRRTTRKPEVATEPSPQPPIDLCSFVGYGNRGFKARWVWVSEEVMAKLGEGQASDCGNEPVRPGPGLDQLSRALPARRVVVGFGGAAPEGEVPVAEVAQQGGRRNDDRLRRYAVQTELDQHGQGNGIDGQRGEVDALEAREITQHMAADAEDEAPMHHEGKEDAQHMRYTDCHQGPGYLAEPMVDHVTHGL